MRNDMHIYPEIERNPLLHLGITEPLRLGIANIIEESPRGVLAYCPAARFHLLGADSIEAAEALLTKVKDPYFIMLLNADFAPLLQRFRLDNGMRCRQAAWLKPDLPEADTRLQIAVPDDRQFERILSVYHMDTPEEMRIRRARGELFFAVDENGEDAGFVGLHPEGCFGLLEVFPEQRGKGYGAALEQHIIRFCMGRNSIPYCQVNVENEISMNLQKKLGMEITEEVMYMGWMNE